MEFLEPHDPAVLGWTRPENEGLLGAADVYSVDTHRAGAIRVTILRVPQDRFGGLLGGALRWGVVPATATLVVRRADLQGVTALAVFAMRCEEVAWSPKTPARFDAIVDHLRAPATWEGSGRVPVPLQLMELLQRTATLAGRVCAMEDHLLIGRFPEQTKIISELRRRRLATPEEPTRTPVRAPSDPPGGSAMATLPLGEAERLRNEQAAVHAAASGALARRNLRRPVEVVRE